LQETLRVVSVPFYSKGDVDGVEHVAVADGGSMIRQLTEYRATPKEFKR
jgi:hypothetical protein